MEDKSLDLKTMKYLGTILSIRDLMFIINLSFSALSSLALFYIPTDLVPTQCKYLPN